MIIYLIVIIYGIQAIYYSNLYKTLIKIDNDVNNKYNICNMLSRVDERCGLMTPQQPVVKQGANTGKAKCFE